MGLPVPKRADGDRFAEEIAKTVTRANRTHDHPPTKTKETAHLLTSGGRILDERFGIPGPPIDLGPGRRRAMRAGRGVSCLRMLAWILPHEERADWLEERRAFLYDLTGIREQTRWIIGDLIALPRHAYTLRTGPKKESA